MKPEARVFKILRVILCNTLKKEGRAFENIGKYIPILCNQPCYFSSVIQLIADWMLYNERIRYFCFVMMVLAKINVNKNGVFATVEQMTATGVPSIRF